MRPCSLSALSIPLLLSACVSAPPGGGSSPGDAPEAGDGPVAEAAQAVCQPGVCCDYDEDGNLYWGELHQHTALSLDAWTMGTLAFPPQAYQFAKGTASIQIAAGSDAGPGATISQPRPLDFMAVTDHAEFLSVLEECVLHAPGGIPGYPGLPAIPGPNPDYTSKYCNAVKSGHDPTLDLVGNHATMAVAAYANCPFGDPTCPQQQTAWGLIVEAAEVANDPCNFTAFAGYEWTGSPYAVTPSPPPGWFPPSSIPAHVPDVEVYTTHRNVIFANSAVPTRPFDAFWEQTDTAPELWQKLETECTGECDAVTIPHNSNQSAGLSLTVDDPSPAGIARQRRYQVAAEVFQHKRNSECDPDAAAPGGGLQDPDCEFEHIAEGRGEPSSFIRQALKAGVTYGGDNPLQLGMVAASDDHNGTPSMVEESDWHGHAGTEDLSAMQRLASQGSHLGPGGITGVWARQNTRAEIFAAIRRREIYATSGPRMRVRVFQSSDPDPCAGAAFPHELLDGDGVGDGVPMGGELSEADLAPGDQLVLAIWAYPDSRPQGVPGQALPRVAEIDRVQVIKVHSDGAGGALEDAPYPVMDGAAPFPRAGGCVHWVDPAFDKTRRAAYYVRVIQEPTWRWTHFDCLRLLAQGSAPAECAPGGAYHQTIEERAWTSPVWFVPAP